jgi:hypothetical protein
MVLAMTWWGWSGLVVALVLILGVWARRAWRTTMRLELVEYLRHELPELQITCIHASELVFSVPGAVGGEGTFSLRRFYVALAGCPADQSAEAEAARLEVFKAVVQTLREVAHGLALDAVRDRPNVLPRLVTDTVLSAMRRQHPAAATLPSWPSGVPGLSVVLVLDRAASVAYLTEAHLGDLGLAVGDALPLAKANLARTFARDTVRSAIADGKSINVVKSCDTFDAARVLLVPDYLEDGESIAAMIPDRDTLVLIAPPADGDWTSHRRMAKNAAGDPLWTEPLLVTSRGIDRAA